MPCHPGALPCNLRPDLQDESHRDGDQREDDLSAGKRCFQIAERVRRFRADRASLCRKSRKSFGSTSLGTDHEKAINFALAEHRQLRERLHPVVAYLGSSDKLVCQVHWIPTLPNGIQGRTRRKNDQRHRIATTADQTDSWRR